MRPNISAVSIGKRPAFWLVGWRNGGLNMRICSAFDGDFHLDESSV